MSRLHYILAAALLLVPGFSRAQQDPLYSQYYNNPMLINPAFAGSLERLYAGFAYRSQWSGVEGGPVTSSFNAHTSLVNNTVGVGMLVVQDQLGDIKNTQYGGVASYRIRLNKSVFSFGMQAGFTRFATDPTAVQVMNNPDPAFNQFTETNFNTGVGVLLQNEKYSIGLSMPRMLASTASQGGQSIQVYSQNFYLFGSYVFNIGEKIQFRPSTLIRATASTPLSADINAIFTINKLYSAGLFTRQFDAYGVLAQTVFSNFRLGYVFEVPGKGSALGFSTHEISLSFSLDVLRAHNHYVNGL